MRVAVWTLFLFVFGVFVLGMAPEMIGVGITPVVGLFAAPARLLANWHSSLANCVYFGLGVLILIAGTHFLIRWLFKARHAKAPEAADLSTPWRLRWTLSGFGILFCVFVAVVSVVLVIHQLYWLRHSSEPWMVSSTRERVGRIHLQHELGSFVEDQQWSTTAVRTYICSTNSGFGQPIWEKYQPVYQERSPGVLQAFLLVPRQSTYGKANFVLLFQQGQKPDWHPLTSLPALLAKIGIRENNASEQLKPFAVSQ